MIKKYSELDRTDLTPVWIGNQERGDGTEFALYNIGRHTYSIHTLWGKGIEPTCECCCIRVATREDALCDLCYEVRG